MASRDARLLNPPLASGRSMSSRTVGVTGWLDFADPARAFGAWGDTVGVTGVNDIGAVLAAGMPPPRRANMSWATTDVPSGWAIDLLTFCDLYEDIAQLPFGTLSAGVRANLERFLTDLAADDRIGTFYDAAYVLATVIHEGRCAADRWAMTWAPVSETRPNAGGGSYFSPCTVRDWDKTPLDQNGRRLEPRRNAAGRSLLGRLRPGEIADADLGNYYEADALVQRAYYGRGYVQITHMDNYRSMDEALGKNNALLLNPELALEHDVAFEIAIYGMVNGCFRGSRTHQQGRGMVGGHKLADYGDNYVAARAIINSPTDHANTIAGYARQFERMLRSSALG